MLRPVHYLRPTTFVECYLDDGSPIRLPVAAGIYKHLRAADLTRLLEDPAIAIDYARRALQIAPWTILREFPANFLISLIEEVDLSASRLNALRFLLSLRHDAGCSFDEQSQPGRE